MKRFLAVLLTLCLLLSLCSCNNNISTEKDETLDFAGENDLLEIEDGFFDNDEGFFIGSWLSYIELLPASFDGSVQSYEAYIGSLADNMKKVGVTDVFVQVRPFCDAVYPSEIAVSSACVSGKQGNELPFDFLMVIIREMKERKISVHGWLNPYRVQNVFDIDKLSEKNIAKTWFYENGGKVVKTAGGLYLNPAKDEVKALIKDTVKELLSNYDLKGIHIDDYFYPDTTSFFDKADYENYKQNGGDLSLQKWRQENVSSLLKELNALVKSFSKDKIFSVSPSADIDKNESVLFADVKRWGSEDGFCDMLMPQIYFGFENKTKPFYETALLWREIATNSSKLVAGLVLYKAGKEDSFAAEGKNEWIENSDILKRQVETVKQLGYDGICLYSASYINFNENSQMKELQNLTDVLL